MFTSYKTDSAPLYRSLRFRQVAVTPPKESSVHCARDVSQGGCVQSLVGKRFFVITLSSLRPLRNPLRVLQLSLVLTAKSTKKSKNTH